MYKDLSLLLIISWFWWFGLRLWWITYMCNKNEFTVSGVSDNGLRFLWGSVSPIKQTNYESIYIHAWFDRVFLRKNPSRSWYTIIFKYRAGNVRSVVTNVTSIFIQKGILRQFNVNSFLLSFYLVQRMDRS